MLLQLCEPLLRGGSGKQGTLLAQAMPLLHCIAWKGLPRPDHLVLSQSTAQPNQSVSTASKQKLPFWALSDLFDMQEEEYIELSAAKLQETNLRLL